MDDFELLEESIHLSFQGVLNQLLLKEKERQHFGRGASITYSNEDFKIEFVYDRGIVEIGLAPLDDDWTVGIESMKALLSLKESDGTLDERDRKLIIATRLSHDEQAQFLLNSNVPISVALNKNNSQETRKEIQALYHERWGF